MNRVWLMIASAGWNGSRMPIAITVDAFTRPGAGHELGQALRTGGTDSPGLPAALGLDLGSQ
jgi:hypothetical protein